MPGSDRNSNFSMEYPFRDVETICRISIAERCCARCEAGHESREPSCFRNAGNSAALPMLARSGGRFACFLTMSAVDGVALLRIANGAVRSAVERFRFLQFEIRLPVGPGFP